MLLCNIVGGDSGLWTGVFVPVGLRLYKEITILIFIHTDVNRMTDRHWCGAILQVMMHIKTNPPHDFVAHNFLFFKKQVINILHEYSKDWMDTASFIDRGKNTHVLFSNFTPQTWSTLVRKLISFKMTKPKKPQWNSINRNESLCRSPKRWITFSQTMAKSCQATGQQKPMRCEPAWHLV